MLNVRPDSKNNRFRAARIQKLKELIDLTLREQPRCRILDVGGTYNFWTVWEDEIDWNTTEIVCVNMDPNHFSDGKEKARVSVVEGNACALQYPDKHFDIAFSNSVIEHVGSWRNMQLMANEVQRVARRYLVQTPYFWFPIEPHSRTPFLHWLPQSIAYRIVMSRQCGFWPKAKTVGEAVNAVQSNAMLDKRQMATLFQDAQIEPERFMGLTKSLIAMKV